MGKARVTDNLGEGQYDFELIYSDERAQARIAQIQAKLDQIDNVELVKLQADLITAQADVDAQADALDDAIANWVSAGTWAAGTDYTLGDRLRISGFATMLCEQSGRSGGIVPVWPDKHGDTIRENHVIWSAGLSETSTTNWSSNTDYAVDDEVTLAINFEFVIDNPETGGGHFEHLNGTATRSGRSGNFEPSWTKGENVDGGVIWRREDNAQAIIEASKDLRELAFLRDKAQAALNVVKTRKLALEREKAWIENHLPAQVLKVAGWCADYSPDIPIDTEVETAEVTGFHHGGLTSAGKAADRTVLIRPQEAPADYPPEVMDPVTGEIAPLPEVPAGQLRHAVACTAAECLYALMIEPGAEKWKPTWRVGVIDSIDRDADTCSVTLLFADAPRYSDLPVQHNINETVVLTDVPIRYMTCNSAAFEVGDRVLIEYPNQDRSFPTVRGFESNPRVCPGGFLCLPKSDTETLNKHVLSFTGGAWRARESDFLAENVTWYGTHSAVISWKGSPVRAIAPEPRLTNSTPTSKFPFTAVHDSAGDDGTQKRYLYQHFGTALKVNGKSQSGPGGTIVGAAVQSIDGVAYLNCITTDNTMRQDKFWRRLFSDPAGAWALLSTWTRPSDIGLHMAGWFFNASGTEASCILLQYYDPGIGQVLYRPTLWTVNHGGLPLDITSGQDLMLTIDTVSSNSCFEQESDASTSSTTKTGTGSRPIAVDYQGDTRVTATYIYDVDTLETTSYSGFSTFTYSASASGSGGLKIRIGVKNVLMNASVTTSGSTSLTNTSGVVVGGIESSFDSIDSLFLYLDLRHDEAVIFERRTQSTETWTASGPPADKFDYALSQTIDRRIYILSSDQMLVNDQEIISDSSTRFDTDLLPGCGAYPTSIEEFFITPEIEAGQVSYANSTADEYAQTDSAGRLFVSIRNGNIDPRFSGYSNHLDDGDPAALTGLAGANPRFYPILLA